MSTLSLSRSAVFHTHTPSPANTVDARPISLNDERLLDSQQLMQGQKTIAIVHNGITYRLQATRLGKLILTK
jgi:hemin uptake protein HemP